MSHDFWYLSRAVGTTAYLLLFVSVALGLAGSTRGAERYLKRALAFDLHRFATVLALVFSVFHVLIILGDGFFNYTVWQLTVPFLSPYRPWQTAAGIFSIYILMLIVLSFYIRRFIGFRAWRTLHYATFLLFAGVTLHGVTAGTDSMQAWAVFMYIACCSMVVGLLAYRVTRVGITDTSAGVMRAAAGMAVALVVLVVLLGVNLYRGGAASSADLAASLPANFQDTIKGTYTQSGQAGNSEFSLQGTAAGDVPLLLTVDLQVSGPSQTANTARVVEDGSGQAICSGKVVALNQGYMGLSCEGTGSYAGASMTLAMRVRADNSGNFSGTLSGQVQEGDGEGGSEDGGGKEG